MYFCRNISRCINLRLHWVSIFVHRVVLKFLSHTRTLKLKMLFIMFELDRVFFNYVSFYKIPQSFFVRKNKGEKWMQMYTHTFIVGIHLYVCRTHRYRAQLAANIAVLFSEKSSRDDNFDISIPRETSTSFIFVTKSKLKINYPMFYCHNIHRT